jgi:hypothetical protein
MADAGRGEMVELRREEPRSWDVSRARCTMFAVGAPLGLVAVTALVLAFLRPPDEAAGDVDRGLVEAVVWAMVAVVSVVAVREFVVLAMFGGGLTAAPEGLEFRWGRRTMLFPWFAFGGAAVESRSSGRGGYDILAVRFLGTGYRWPRAISLWFTEPTCLCITPQIMARPAARIALELEAAAHQLALATDGRAAGAPPAYTRQRTQESLDRGRLIKGGLGAVGSFLVVAFCLAALPTALNDPELSVGGLLLVAVIMAVVGMGCLVYARRDGRR